MTIQSAKQFCSMIEAVQAKVKRKYAKHPFHMTRAELDALPEKERIEAQAAINDVVFGDAKEREYLAGDYDMIASRRRYEIGE